MERLVSGFYELVHGLRIILSHRIFWACLTAWFTASLIKVVIFFFQNRRFDFKLLVDTGRMPSSHSAFVSSLATVIGLEAGWSNPVFMLALGFAIVTMNDAQGVRRASGCQAAVLNRILDDMNQRKPFQAERLKEFLGHTPVQVFAGSVIGVVMGLLFYI